MFDIFSHAKKLPTFVTSGLVRDDVLSSYPASIPIFRLGAMPVVGQVAALELQLDDERCTWRREDDRNAWCIVKGTIAKATPSSFIVEQLTVTTDHTPVELEGNMRALVQKAGSAWELAQLFASSQPEAPWQYPA